MISVEEALRAIDNQVSVGSVCQIAVSRALGYTLSADVLSLIDMPPFPQSAMDGYAIRFHQKSSFKLVDEVKAGDVNQPVLEAGEAVRIFTGAPVPDKADAVVRQEDVQVENQLLKVDLMPMKQANIRPQAEQIGKGEIALKKGHRINEASIGYLTTLGITMVSAYKKPVVSILITGNELVEPGKEIKYGQIYDSNAPMLAAALKKTGIDEVAIHNVRDDYESTKAQLKEILNASDIVICSGGISVGDYDFVRKALLALDVNEVFYKVKQKPGKPLFFGKLNEKLVFALPGNPAAALTCFYVYVAKAIALFMGNPESFIKRGFKKITNPITCKGHRAQFLKASIIGDEVSILEGQSSAMLHTFALANALAFAPIDVNDYQKGDEIECILLP